VREQKSERKIDWQRYRETHTRRQILRGMKKETQKAQKGNKRPTDGYVSLLTLLFFVGVYVQAYTNIYIYM